MKPQILLFIKNQIGEELGPEYLANRTPYNKLSSGQIRLEKLHARIKFFYGQFGPKTEKVNF